VKAVCRCSWSTPKLIWNVSVFIEQSTLLRFELVNIVVLICCYRFLPLTAVGNTDTVGGAGTAPVQRVLYRERSLPHAANLLYTWKSVKVKLSYVPRFRLILSQYSHTEKQDFNPSQPKVFRVNLSVREIGRIFFLIKYAILSFGKCLNY